MEFITATPDLFTMARDSFLGLSMGQQMIAGAIALGAILRAI